MSKSQLFISDWAGYPDFYPNLAGSFDFMLPFISHSEREIFERLDSATGGTLIAWSMGAHMALKRWNRIAPNFDRIILISPFLSFTDYASEKVIRKMIRDIRSNPQEVVGAYHRKCGFPGTLTVDGRDIDGLLTGLEYLRASRAMPSHVASEKTTIIHGEYDRIVNPHASEDIWEIIPQATYSALAYGHWIPEKEFVGLAGE